MQISRGVRWESDDIAICEQIQCHKVDQNTCTGVVNSSDSLVNVFAMCQSMLDLLHSLSFHFTLCTLPDMF